ncbi:MULTISPECIES: metallophosphoesterase family protein [unclassified Candidatus Frackibacter]|uniref:metallophosphoesterase family protein n=1 Tax=unclassified Candidatus Frackibacter TaxID=2648818 RepID=UPI00088CA3FC|nr:MULTISPECIES: DNA repair exonuclease [unclassified Candidatus Frackibacter]SDC37314.1 DNA repair exonuclease SbcCD nuclease subunit [Candidatus Frackibacter sp. WG11]SEM62763.1 DNA repair exonuclease SbcCD nuclease subunit [Candidatus Frackibacter sp. WG12]SFL65011.1 DNA repair exonuclease SbcCD nuclease subunit [Candidatus Frackibacter sp. WG13]
MSTIKFIHAADLHLGSSFQGVKEVDEDLHQLLYNSTYQAFRNIVDLALEEEVDFILIAGDLYDIADMNIRAQIFCQRELKRLAIEGIHTFIVHGNHDHCGGWRAKLDWPEEVHFFSPDKVEKFSFLKDGVEVVKIHGISYSERNIKENYLPKFDIDDETLYHIGLLHTNVDSNSNYQDYAPCRLSELIKKDFDYWALGHIHKRQVLYEASPTVIYPGNIQGRHPNETGVKGCYLVEISEERIVDYQFMATDVVRWYQEEIDLTGVNEEQVLLDKIQTRINEIKERDKSAVVRLKVKGRTELHKKLKKDNYCQEILLALRENWQHRDRFCWLDSLEVATKPDVDKERLRCEETLVGDFLQLAKESREDDLLLDELRRAIKQVYKEDNRASKLLKAPSDEQLKELILKAEDLGLDLLLEGGD